MSAEPDPPSARAVQRLATGVGEDVADLRTQLRQALERADRLEADGRQDLAVEVLEEQRDALLDMHCRLQERLAGAVVEREAERVVGAASVAAPGPASSGAASDSLDQGLALRLVASAAAAVLGIALLLSPGSDTAALTAAGSDAEGGTTAPDAHSDDTDAVADPEVVAGPGGAPGPAVFPSSSALAGGPTDVVRPTDLRGLPIPEAHVLLSTPDEDDQDDASGLAGLTEQLPSRPALERLTPGASDDPVSEGGDDGDEGDDERESDDEPEPADGGESELLGR